LFDKDGDVYAFFHYYTTDDTATSYCPSPDPLIDAGYRLGNVSTVAPSRPNWLRRMKN